MKHNVAQKYPVQADIEWNARIGKKNKILIWFLATLRLYLFNDECSRIRRSLNHMRLMPVKFIFPPCLVTQRYAHTRARFIADGLHFRSACNRRNFSH